MKKSAVFFFLSFAVWGLAFMGVSRLEASQTDFLSSSFSTEDLDVRDNNNTQITDSAAKLELELVYVYALNKLLSRPDIYVIALQLEKLKKQQNPDANAFNALQVSNGQAAYAITSLRKFTEESISVCRIAITLPKDTSSLNTVKETEVSSINNTPTILRC